ncbi:PorT family protein [Psychroserpens sp. SPM9]|uniref:PorT family protein n=1 Tax=Psychroserpens sp. SPM9 TaxID=2975598 RepID=UPI0021A3C163|nr:PorT family protein [Psychroserpens sp. SPM9]MDG5490119.1 PorT family protein [Psychroserpens sp. SPM9]
METKKDFGAAVKQKLESYKDRPDDLVWTHIEAQLKKKKKRRGFIIWFFGAGLGILLVTLLLINPFKNSIENSLENTDTTPVNPTTEQQRTTKIKLETETETETQTITETETVTETETETVTETETEAETETKANFVNTNTIKNFENQSANTHHLYQTENSNTSNIKKQQLQEPPSNSEALETTKEPSDNVSAADKTQMKRERAIAKRDSLIALKNKMRDSIREQRESNRLTSEELLKEKAKDSSEQDDQSRWSITPQAIVSYYGALNAKTSDNISINYGVLASYRMTSDTYLRLGVRKLYLNQTLSEDNSERTVEYLEFPLEVKYAPFNSQFNPYFTGGLSYFKLREGSNSDTNSFEYKATMGLNLGLGIETKVFKNFFFNLESNFNYQLKPFTQKNSIDPFIFSLSTGLEYRF